MYAPKYFTEGDAEGLAAAEAHPFALLLTWNEDAAGPPVATHLPLILDPTASRPTMLGHVARANPHARHLESARPGIAVFSGPDAYVSPNWYPSKQAGGDAVPTWNYVAVHITGALRPLPDVADRRRAVDLLSRHFEGDGPGAWRLDDEPEDFVRKMLGGIVAFSLEIERIEAKAKLSQNRNEADRAGVVAALEAAGGEAAAVAAAMRSRGLGA